MGERHQVLAEGTPAVGKRLDQAIKDDLFVWNSQYDPQTGLVCGHRIDSERQWRLRVEKDGGGLWQKTVLGAMAHRCYSWGLWTSGRDGFPAKMPASGKMMIAETAVPLESGNEFGLPADTYYVCTGYDPETGQRLAAWVSRYQQQGQVDLVHREYDAKTGRVRSRHCKRSWKTVDWRRGAKARAGGERPFAPSTRLPARLRARRPSGTTIMRMRIIAGLRSDLRVRFPGPPGLGGFLPYLASYSAANLSASFGLQRKHCDFGRLCSLHQSPFRWYSAATLALHWRRCPPARRVRCTSSRPPNKTNQRPAWLTCPHPAPLRRLRRNRQLPIRHRNHRERSRSYPRHQLHRILLQASACVKLCRNRLGHAPRLRVGLMKYLSLRPHGAAKDHVQAPAAPAGSSPSR